MPVTMRYRDPRRPWGLVWALAIAQIVSWGSLYYAFSVLLVPMERELGWDRSTLVGAFSAGLLFGGLASWPAGALIDRLGGRALMAAGSLAAAGLLACLAHTQTVWAFYAIWIGLGVVMAAVLYEPAFTVIYQAFKEDARKAITALTLVAGFASTVFWPLTQWLVDGIGWRSALCMLATFNLLICVPVHLFMLPAGAPRAPHSSRAEGTTAASGHLRRLLRSREFWLLAAAFTANMLAFSALSVHLIPMLGERGLSGAQAVALAALIGPMQVAGRIIEYMTGRRVSIVHSGLVALALLPVGLVLLLVAGTQLLILGFALVVYGASNGVMTIVRAAIPAELFGRQAYGATNGALSAPVIAARALAPAGASALWTALGGYEPVLWVLGILAGLAVVCFWAAVRDRHRETAP